MTRTIAILAGATLLAGCAAGPGPREQIPHGYVEGAQEAAEPQLRLVLHDGRGGPAHVLDLLTERSTEIAPAARPGARAITGDGRYAFLTTADGGLRVIDGGGWTVDHGDHAHYYRAVTRDLGTIAGRPPYTVTGDTALTAVRSGDGTVTLYDRARMDRGELAGTGRLTADAVVPHGQRLLVAHSGAVQVRPRTGEPGAAVGACADPEGTALTRRGVVFGCADGALLVTEKDGTFDSVKIRYPRGTAAGERARAFRHRPGSSTLAARAGQQGLWVLDVTARTWRLVRTGPVVAVNATGDDTPVLSLTGDGVLRAHDPATGRQTAGTKLLDGPAAGAVSIEVDTARAYVNDPAGRAVHEIDYNDGLRRARTLRPGLAPAYMTETGR
ncbi:ABC transporter [Nonomuraea sp. MG754425]|uniref:ABC transporter n=1 Tax=Nonomuraea sp. MG754425 TaxID=2570319 RepID=UPI001F432243|nr:ABC transporter [Nonomuraea sp. MG754425]